MVPQQMTIQHPSLDRLDVAQLGRLVEAVGLHLSGWTANGESLDDLPPEVVMRECSCAPEQPCRAFLAELARDARADRDVQYHQCGTETFAAAARLDPADTDSPIVLACGRVSRPDGTPVDAPRDDHSPEIAWRAAAFARISQEWYARERRQVREVEVLSESLAETYEELSFIHRLNDAMNLAASHRAYFQGLAEDLRDLLAAQAVVIRLHGKGSADSGDIRADTLCAGRPETPVEMILAGVESEHLAKRGYHIRIIAGDTKDGEPGGEQLLAAPIVRQSEQLGIIVVVRAPGEGKFNNIDVTRVSSIAKSTAVILDNFRLYDDLRQLFLGTVRALTRSIDAKDRYTCGHSERVATISRRLLLELGGTEQQADRVYLCGMLHDIGKIGIPEDVLRKPGRLTPHEFAIIKRHPAVGAAILSGIEALEDIIPGVLHHHERVDGQGYPTRLKGDEISLHARVIAVADTFDAMTSERPYRKSLSVTLAMEELQRHAGTQFDPVVVEAMRRLNPVALVEELGRSRDSCGESLEQEDDA